MAEGGLETTQINTPLLLNNYPIFIDKEFQKYLTYKFYYMSHLTGNSLASLKLGDFFHEGFGGLQKKQNNIIKIQKGVKLSQILLNYLMLILI